MGRSRQTHYRVAQHWRFRTETPEVKDTFVITAVEDHPTQGIVCAVEIAYDPPFRMSHNMSMSGANYWFTEAALDDSVTELVAEKGPFPRHLGSTGEFRRTDESWGSNPHPFAETRTVDEVVRDGYAHLVRQRDEAANRPPYVEPPDEALGLWSLISYDKADRFRELLEQHPTIANSPLPRDLSDDYCYDGDEYEECYPLMLAAELSSVEVAKVLLSFGADVCKQNSRGDTALHFSGKASSGGCGANDVARMLCENGADPNARNKFGKPPLTCYYCTTEVAEVLVEFGAKLNLNHALRLRNLKWVRRHLRENPQVVEEAAYPNHVVDDVVQMFRQIAGERTGSWDYDQLAGWYRAAEIERQVFEEHRDILDGVLACGADPKVGSALFDAVANFDTALAEALLEHGADPNHALKQGQATYMTDIARTQRMVNLLKQYGATENPYPHELDKWERRTQELKEQFV
ncbi:MAG: ankyrin repeat domain-containing protein [Planctomycetaceae bacterium]|nr:ankyrin repeat domain-containing protein [Planctomycetaceae bacterium]